MEKIDLVDLKEVSNYAGELFNRGDFYCSEAVVASMKEFFDPAMPEAIISTASGFPVGIGGEKCVCGAISGGIISLGYFFGRTKAGDPKVANAMKLGGELHKAFTHSNKVACCSVLTSSFDMNSGEHKAQCARFTSEMAYKTGEIIAREINIPVVK